MTKRKITFPLEEKNKKKSMAVLCVQIFTHVVIFTDNMWYCTCGVQGQRHDAITSDSIYIHISNNYSLIILHYKTLVCVPLSTIYRQVMVGNKHFGLKLMMNVFLIHIDVWCLDPHLPACRSVCSLDTFKIILQHQTTLSTMDFKIPRCPSKIV